MSMSSIPPSVQVPSIGAGVVIEPDHASIIDDASKVFTSVGFPPSLSGNAIRPGRREDPVPRAAIAIAGGQHVISPLLRPRLDRPRRGKKVEGEGGTGGRAKRDEGWGMRDEEDLGMPLCTS
jgi:hypothetical protein